jgi:hypothetical protein
VQDWSESSVWSWTASEGQVGRHVIAVSVKDGRHNEEGDGYSSGSFNIDFSPNKGQNRIMNVRFTPETPANLVFGEPVKISFDYQKNQTEDVLIYSDFMIGGRIVGPPFDYFTSGSPYYSDATGSGEFDLSIDSNKIVTIEGVKVYMTDKGYKNICEIITPVQFHYGPNNISSELQSMCANGNTRFIQNNYEEAITYFDQAIQMAPGSKYAWKDRGDALSAIADYEKAIESYDEALRIEPKFAEAWRDKGEALFLSGKYEEAVKCFDEAINCYDNGSLYNDGDIDGAREGKAKVLNAMGRNFLSEKLDVVDTGLVTLQYCEETLPAGNFAFPDRCSYNFFALPDQPAKTYGSVDYGDFYFGNKKFFANNAGMRGLVDLGPIEFDIDRIKIPIEGFYHYGVEAITGHVYLSPARWCARWEGDKYNISECGEKGRYIIFRVKDINTESGEENVDIEYMLAKAKLE